MRDHVNMNKHQRKTDFHAGQRIRLLHMEDRFHPVPDGTEGEIEFIDDAGQLHMKWDNGRTLALIPGVDSFVLI